MEKRLRIYARQAPSEGDAVSEGHWLRLLSLPRRLGVTPEDPLMSGPYLSCSNALFAHWLRILAPERRPIIGLHWQGNPDSELGGLRGRSLALEALAPIAAAGIGSLLSLQRGSGAAAASSWRAVPSGTALSEPRGRWTPCGTF